MAFLLNRPLQLLLHRGGNPGSIFVTIKKFPCLQDRFFYKLCEWKKMS